MSATSAAMIPYKRAQVSIPTTVPFLVSDKEIAGTGPVVAAVLNTKSLSLADQIAGSEVARSVVAKIVPSTVSTTPVTIPVIKKATVTLSSSSQTEIAEDPQTEIAEDPQTNVALQALLTSSQKQLVDLGYTKAIEKSPVETEQTTVIKTVKTPVTTVPAIIQEPTVVQTVAKTAPSVLETEMSSESSPSSSGIKFYLDGKEVAFDEAPGFLEITERVVKNINDETAETTVPTGTETTEERKGSPAGNESKVVNAITGEAIPETPSFLVEDIQGAVESLTKEFKNYLLPIIGIIVIVLIMRKA